MQRASNLSRKRALALEDQKLTKRRRTLPLSSDLLFLISAHDNRIYTLLQIDQPRMIQRPVLYDTYTSDTHLIHSSPSVFNYSLCRYPKLKEIEIHNTRKLYFKSLNDVQLDKLAVTGAREIGLEDARNIKVHTLELSSTTLCISQFLDIIRLCCPSKVVLKHVACLSYDSASKQVIGGLFSECSLLGLECYSSFIGLGHFFHLVEKYQLKHFVFHDSKPVISYMARGAGTSSCVMGNYVADCPLSPRLLGSVEYLEVTHPSHLKQVDYVANRLKYLRVHNMVVDTNLIRWMYALRGISLVGCHFTSISFYDFIRALSKTVRFLSLELTQIPLDGVTFIKETLSACQVVIAGIAQFFVPRRNDSV